MGQRDQRLLGASVALVLMLGLATWFIGGAVVRLGDGDTGALLGDLDTRAPVEERIRGFEELIQLHNINPEAVLRLSDGYAIAAVAGEQRVRVMEFYLLPTGEAHARELAGGEHGGSVPAFMLETSSGATGSAWNSIFFGTAPSNVSRVIVEGRDAEGGYVVGRAWVLLLRDKGIHPTELPWRFLDSDGNSLLRGVGLTPIAGGFTDPSSAP